MCFMCFPSFFLLLASFFFLLCSSGSSRRRRCASWQDHLGRLAVNRDKGEMRWQPSPCEFACSVSSISEYILDSFFVSLVSLSPLSPGLHPALHFGGTTLRVLLRMHECFKICCAEKYKGKDGARGGWHGQDAPH